MGLPGGGIRRREDQVKNSMESSATACEQPGLSQAPAWKHSGVQGTPGCPFHHLFLQGTADPFVLGIQGYTQTWFLISLLTFSLSLSPWFVDHSPPPPISPLPSSILAGPCSHCALSVSHALNVILFVFANTGEPWALALALMASALAQTLLTAATFQESQPSQPGCSSRILPEPSEWRSRGNSTLSSLQLLSSSRSHSLCRHRLPLAPAVGWILTRGGTCARCHALQNQPPEA